MAINNLKCETCRHFHAPREGVARPVISEAQVIKRSGAPFYECPACFRLYAIKAIAGSSPVRFDIISSASVTVQHEWMVDGEDGSRQKAKNKMTEAEAAEKYPTAVKMPLRMIGKPH